MLTDPSFLYIATIFPPILLGIIIWKSDKFPEPGKFLVASFLLGVSISFPLHLFVMITEDHIAPMFGLDLDSNYNVMEIFQFSQKSPLIKSHVDAKNTFQLYPMILGYDSHQIY